MIITDSNMPVCEKCGERAMTMISKMWLCGKCTMELNEKLIKLKKKLLLEE